MAEYDDEEGSGFAKLAIAGVVILTVVGGAVYWFLSSSNGPQRQPAPPIVQLKLLPPPPPPPPPPKVPPPEPHKLVNTPKMSQPLKVTASAPPRAPGPPPSGLPNLGLRGGGGPGGLSSGSGGDGGDGDGGGGGTVQGYYASQVKGALGECVAEDGRLIHAAGHVRFVVHIDDDGNVTDVDFQSRFDSARDNTALEDIIRHCKMDAPPTDAPAQFNLHEVQLQLGAVPSHS